MKLKTKIIFGIIVFLLVFSTASYLGWQKEKKERKRQESNVEQLTKTSDQTNLDLELTRKKFAKMNTDWSNRMKSVIEESDIKLSQVKEYYELQLSYRDTSDRMAQMGEPVEIKEPDKKTVTQTNQSRPMFKVPFSSEKDSCQYVKGLVISTDPQAKVQITESGFNVTGDLFATRGRFLGFLWWKKPTEYVAVTNCGEIKYRHLKFIKK